MRFPRLLEASLGYGSVASRAAPYLRPILIEACVPRCSFSVSELPNGLAATAGLATAAAKAALGLGVGWPMDRLEEKLLERFVSKRLFYSSL